MSSIDLGYIKAEIVRIRLDMDKLSKIVIDGNGSALVSKVAIMENKIETISGDLEKLAEYGNTVKISLLVALLSFAGSILLLFIELALKK